MQRPRSHQAGELAENLVERLFIADGWIANKLQRDYGFDFLIQRLPDEESSDSAFAFLQVKGTDKQLLPLGDRSFSFSFDVADLVYWQKSPIPVYLVIVELLTARAFVLEVKVIAGFLETQLGEPCTFNTSRSFDVPGEALYTAQRGIEIIRDVKNYWNVVRFHQKKSKMPSECHAFLPPLPKWVEDIQLRAPIYFLINPAHIQFQQDLTEILGSREEMLRMVNKAGL